MPAPAVPAGTDLRIPGLTPFFTSNASFYRVDTDLVLPQVAPETWTLRIDGMVNRELEITFAELLRMPLTQTDITLVCVSNQVGGPYAGNARWLGAPLAALLRRAGVRAGADQVLSSAVDGMTISTPLTAIMDGRDALLAVGMNGQPLPIAHGFPARMVVPGLYGYTSATKWVTRLTVTTFAAQRAYWTQRGYAAVAPIHTESRIDVPRPLAQLAAGRWRWPEWPGRPPPASPRCRSAWTTAPGTPPGWPPPTASTPGGSGCGPGTPPPGCTSSRSGPPTTRA